jgi:hypothetical protein
MRIGGDDRGAALVVALMAMLLLTALGLSLVVTTDIEALSAANYRQGRAALEAADAAVARALADLGPMADWNPVLAGLATSTFTDGPPGSVRVLPDGVSLDLIGATRLINCGTVSACTPADMAGVTDSRPWGPNNPHWRLYAHAPVDRLLPEGEILSPFYVVVWVGDDPAENDGDPMRDGIAPDSPGAGVIALRAETFGPGGGHRALEVTVARPGPDDPATAGLRVGSWREVR